MTLFYTNNETFKFEKLLLKFYNFRIFIVSGNCKRHHHPKLILNGKDRQTGHYN